jgi:hypothetical protein
VLLCEYMMYEYQPPYSMNGYPSGGSPFGYNTQQCGYQPQFATYAQPQYYPQQQPSYGGGQSYYPQSAMMMPSPYGCVPREYCAAAAASPPAYNPQYDATAAGFQNSDDYSTFNNNGQISDGLGPMPPPPPPAPLGKQQICCVYCQAFNGVPIGVHEFECFNCHQQNSQYPVNCTMQQQQQQPEMQYGYHHKKHHHMGSGTAAALGLGAGILLLGALLSN